MSKKIIIFTDGAVPNNQLKGNRKGGIGVFFGLDDPRNISFSIKETQTYKVTNQVCELMACLLGLEKLVKSEKITKKTIEIRTDSMYVVKTINDWAKKWEKNNWLKSDKTPVLNLDLVKPLYYLSKNLNVNFVHVPAHKTEPKKESEEYFNWYGNYWADKLAVNATKF